MNIRKVLLSAVGILLVIIITLFFLFLFPFLGTKKVQAGSQFAEGRIVNVVDGIAQVFIINGGNGEIGLVDAGNSSDGKPLIDALASKGLKPSDVKAIFLTHGHHDHIAAAKLFSQAKIYSLKEEVKIAEGIKNNPSPLGRITSPKPSGFKVSHIFNDGDKVKLGSLDVEVFAIPGHTEGSAAYIIGGVLFLGDAALSSSDGKIKHAVWAFSSDVEQQNRSLKTLAERLKPRKNDIKTIVFSHSGYLDGLQPLVDFASQIEVK
jgi:glyoxylase-like metal-dependent hydrolase (beta-lactamase superfamily II)